MLDGNYSLTVTACGISVAGKSDLQATEGIPPVSTLLPVGKAGVLTRSDSDTGVATLGTGHGIQSADVVDVHWEGGCRYGMTATVDGNAVTVDGGAGGNLPATAATAVVVTKPETLDVSFDGDNLTLIGVGSSQQTMVKFVDGGGAAVGVPFLLKAGGAWGWSSDLLTASPLAGNAIVGAKVSNGSAVSEAGFKMCGLQYAE